MAGKDDNLVATVLQSYGGIDDQSFSTANAQIRMEECNGLLRGRFRHGWSGQKWCDVHHLEDTLTRTSSLALVDLHVKRG
jgi:hypothetical protein